MTEQELLKAAAQAIVDTDEEASADIAREAAAMGLESVKVINEGFSQGMVRVGDLFERGQMFLPEVIITSEAMMAAVKILEENLRAEARGKSVGSAVIGTVEGDVHDIGKGIVAMLLRVYGFEVHDLVRDVALSDFVDKVRETGAEILGTSALMTTTMMGQRTLEKLLTDAGVRDQVKTMVGGAVVTQYWADKIGAHAYAEDAQEAVAKALELAAT